MKEYRSILFEADQGFTGPKGAVDTKNFDQQVNRMATDGWELVFVENLNKTHGSSNLLLVFSRPLAPEETTGIPT
jgi:hypothetical protein